MQKSIIFDKYITNYQKQYGKLSLAVYNNLATMVNCINIRLALFNQEVVWQQVAYLMATVKHETDDTFGTFKEVRQERTDTPRRKEVRRLQDRYWYTGYYGRGPVQLTWLSNYKWAQALTGSPLLHYPDLLLTDLSLGYEVIILGMVRGKLTGKSLNSYIYHDKTTNKDVIDYINARRIVNGTDVAEKIAGYAKTLYTILISSIEG